MISVHFQGKPFKIMVIQVYTPTSNAEEAEVEWSYEDLQDLLEVTPKKKKKVIFLIGDWNAKAGSQQIPGAKANRLLPRKHTGHSKYPLPTTQEKTLHMDITRLSIQK